MSYSTLTILDALRERSQGFLTDGSLQLVCVEYGKEPDEEYSELTEQDRDILLGSMYYWMYTTSTGGSTEKVSDGGWSHSESKQVSNADVDKWARLHRMYYLKWGLDPLIDAPSGIKLINF